MVAEQVGVGIARVLLGDDAAVVRPRVRDVAIALRLRRDGKWQEQNDEADQRAQVASPFTTKLTGKSAWRAWLEEVKIDIAREWNNESRG